MVYVCFFLSNLFLGTVIMQLIATIFGYKPQKCRVIVMLCLVVNTLASMIVLTPETWFSFEARFIIVCLCYILRISAYQFIFRRIKLKIAYICILSYITNSFYEILLTAIIPDTIIRSVAAFIVEAVFIIFILAVIRRKDSEEFVIHSLEIIPKRLYVVIMIFLYVFTMYIYLSSSSTQKVVFRQVANILMMPMIVLIILIIYWLARIVIREQSQKNISQLLSMHLEDQIEYYESVNERYTKIRSINHDFKNHLLCLRSLLNENETDKAMKYIDEMEKTVSSEKLKYDTGNIIADIILNNKSEAAKNQNTDIVFSGAVPSSGITNADLCVIIANAIDNAIEACAKDENGEEKIISVDSVSRQGYFIFRVVNPVFEHVEIGDKYSISTSKEDKLSHGFGVANIIGISEKYNGGVHISSDDDKFTLEATLMLETDTV